MQGRMIVIKPSEPGPLAYDFARALNLEDIKNCLDGGYLEAVPYFHQLLLDGQPVRCIAFCDEEGKLKNLPTNRAATMLWFKSLEQLGLAERYGPRSPAADVLVGPVVVVTGDDEFMEAL